MTKVNKLNPKKLVSWRSKENKVLRGLLGLLPCKLTKSAFGLASAQYLQVALPEAGTAECVNDGVASGVQEATPIHLIIVFNTIANVNFFLIF
jgi:hypothetical protein